MAGGERAAGTWNNWNLSVRTNLPGKATFTSLLHLSTLNNQTAHFQNLYPQLLPDNVFNLVDVQGNIHAGFRSGCKGSGNWSQHSHDFLLIAVYAM